MQHDICFVITKKSSSHRLLCRLVPILATTEIFCLIFFKPSPELLTSSSSATAIAIAMLREGQLMRGLLLGGGDGGGRGRHLGLPRVDDVLHATHLARRHTLASRAAPLLTLGVPSPLSSPHHNNNGEGRQ